MHDAAMRAVGLKVNKPALALRRFHVRTLMWAVDICSALRENDAFLVWAKEIARTQYCLGACIHAAKWREDVVVAVALVKFRSFQHGHQRELQLQPVDTQPNREWLYPHNQCDPDQGNRSADLQKGPNPFLPGGLTFAVALCCIGWKKRRGLFLAVLLIVSAIGVAQLTACGGSSSKTGTVTINAAGGGTTVATTVNVVVK